MLPEVFQKLIMLVNLLNAERLEICNNELCQRCPLYDSTKENDMCDIIMELYMRFGG